MNISKIIIDRVVKEMLESAQDLGEVIIIPNSYSIYIHTDDYKDIKHFLNILCEEITKKLDKEIQQRSKSNAQEGKSLRNIVNKLLGFDAIRGDKEYRRVSDRWNIHFQESKGRVLFQGKVFELKKGEVGIIRSFSSTDSPNLNSQYKTLVTIYKKNNDINKTIIESDDISRLPTLRKPFTDSRDYPYLARIEYTYKGSSDVHIYFMRKNKITIGRMEGDGVDLSLILASDRISRKHLEIGVKDNVGKFFLRNLGIASTTLNGISVPNDTKTEHDPGDDNEVELPHSSRISLAGGEVFLDFFIK